MGKRKWMKHRYRRFSFLSDVEGMKNAIGEMRGKFFPKQPLLNKDFRFKNDERAPDEKWFIKTLTDKIAGHPENAMEYPFYGEPIFIYGCGLCAARVPCESRIPKPLQP